MYTFYLEVYLYLCFLHLMYFKTQCIFFLTNKITKKRKSSKSQIILKDGACFKPKRTPSILGKKQVSEGVS